jgi:signal transduction histidine kinase/ligand-binding sensor domain-containing protein
MSTPVRRSVLFLTAIWVQCVFALNPALDVSQYAHTSWKIRDGFTKGMIHSIAQTPDGYLWLGTEFGLMRFDGVKNVAWQPPHQRLPSNQILKLLTSRDGTLWIGTMQGLANWKDGAFTQFPQFAGHMISALFEDREGSIWASWFGFPGGRLCTIREADVQCFGEDGSIGHAVFGIYEDTKGTLWGGVPYGLLRWKPGPPRTFPMPDDPDGPQGFAEESDGSLLITSRHGIQRFVDGKIHPHDLHGGVGQLVSYRMMRDHDGGLWIGTSSGGVLHQHHGRVDAFTERDGLSGAHIAALLEDREGNVWVATQDGLDRFRDFTVATFSASQGLPPSSTWGLLKATDGSLWFGTSEGLARWDGTNSTIYRARGWRPGSARGSSVREVRDSGLPNPIVESIFEDHRGRIWAATFRGTGYLEDNHFTAINGLPGGIVHAFAEDNAGNVWVANQELGVFRWSATGGVQAIKLENNTNVTAMAGDSKGGMWIGTEGRLVYVFQDQVRASHTSADGLGEGRLNAIEIDPDGALWASTESGLSRLKDGRIATLSSKNGLPCDGVHWTLEDDERARWLFMPCGLVRIARQDLVAWAAAVSKDNTAKPPIRAALFDTSDGVRLRSGAGGYTPHAAKSADGKLWFFVMEGISVIDPRRLPVNQLPPPVHVEQIIADRKTYAAGSNLRLPALVRDLEIDYAALSLVAPERVLFRYKLEGWDKDWQDAGTRRQAFYSGLDPRNYRFRVMACNNSGVWNEAGTFLDFSVAPAYYQTSWFRLAALAALLLLGAGLYRLRVRQLAGQFNMRLEERVGERIRIARDLHDTLLQSLAGVSLQLDGISRLTDISSRAATMIGRVQEQVRSAFQEARDKIWNLRSPILEGRGLTAVLADFVEQLDRAGGVRCSFSVSGHARPLAANTEEELLRIAQEAASNANRHAQANHIRVALEYSKNAVALSITDDGSGFNLEEGVQKAGHWGLKNMQERAAQLGGTCQITTAIGQGTCVQVEVPASSPSGEKIRAKSAHPHSDR